MAFGILEPFELFFSMIRIISRTILLIITLFIAIMSNGLYQAIPGYTIITATGTFAGRPNACNAWGDSIGISKEDLRNWNICVKC